MKTLSNCPALSHYIRRVTQAALASTLICCAIVTSALATQVNLQVFGAGEQPNEQFFILQAVEKINGVEQPLITPDPDDPRGSVDWFYVSRSKPPAAMVKKSFQVNDPQNLNLSFVRIETFNPKSKEILLKNKKSIVVCHGYRWLNTAIKAVLEKNPNTTELNIDMTLHTTYLPDPANKYPTSPGLGVWGTDPSRLTNVFIEASSCQVTFNINGQKFPVE